MLQQRIGKAGVELWIAAPCRLIAQRSFAEIPESRGAVMMWKQERDLLIAQTMAFVQSVTGKPVDASGSFQARPPSLASDQPPPAGLPADVPRARLVPIIQSELRDEIHRRVAAFRARQQVFHRDRDAYCNAMMAKARASSEQAVKARDLQPPGA